MTSTTVTATARVAPCASPPPDRSTTARARSSAACCTTPRPCSRISSQAVVKASRRYGDGETNLALLTDGLRAEREQGITIDVAHRYFATPRRSFIVADTPGHAQYTRNMVTGASTADVAIVLVDARHGVLEQTRRHAFIATLLGVKAIVVAVNKMDLIDWDEAEFDCIAKEVIEYVQALPTPVPVVGHPDVGPARRQRGRCVLEHAVVRRPAAARLARGVRCEPAARGWRARCTCNASSVPKAASSPTSAAMPESSTVAAFASATP